MSDEVTIIQKATDDVQIMRTWAVIAPDWTPQYKTRVISPSKVVAVWVNGKINRVAVMGPYRMKSGAVAVPKFARDESHIGGTGDPDYRTDWHRMTYCYDGRWDAFPSWVPQFIAGNAPMFPTQEG